MKEKLIDIVSNIDACAKARRGKGIAPAARAHCLFDNKEDTYWFCSSYFSIHDLDEVAKYGHFVPKNSRLAIKLQSIEVGSSFDYEQLDKIKKLRTHYVTLENRTDFQNQTISIAGDSLQYQYRNISDFLEALQQNKEDIKHIENEIEELNKISADLKKQKVTAHQRAQITKSINELQKEYRILTQQQEDLKNITIYIRKQGEMRYSLIVDPIQTRIKSQNIFDGKTIIINGGPGTGKSTTMIHRLAYLTDLYAIDEDEKNAEQNFKLTRKQRQQLRDAITSNRDWMFFSPSQMLKEYLADAMRKEGLKNTSQKVWNWKEYCRQILQFNYKLIDKDGNAPFRVCNLEGTLFYQNSNIIDELLNYYLGELRQIKSKLPKINAEGKVYEWTAIAQGIEKRFENSESFDLGRFVALFNTLESVYSEDCKAMLRNKKEAICNLSKEICDLLDKNKAILDDIKDILDLTSETGSEEENEEESEIEAEEVPAEKEETTVNKIVSWIKSIGTKKEKEENTIANDKFSTEIQKWTNAFCYNKVNPASKLSDVHMLMTDLIQPVLGEQYNSQMLKIGELIVFEQFAQYTRGIKAIMLTGIPTLYKKFRTNLSRSKYQGCNLKLLKDVMQRYNGRELHHQEQALLLGFVNTLVKQIKTSTSAKIKHHYIEAYEEVARPIIGIDEATDFSVCDIYAMQSLLTRDFNSLTLCGDMMQRMTTYGIKSWTELDGIVPNPTVVEMKTSYRQSKKVLEVARQLYIDTLGETPSYKAFMKSTKVPAPLFYVDENESAKIQWISKRISEVYRAYGEQLPSIAIFVNDKGYIPRFIESLQLSEFFSKNDIKVLDGTTGNKKIAENHICVYPIDVVKGMEFDVVFFHNIDNSSADTEIVKRYIYVGVSRAAFFLGITMNEKKQDICKYFVQNKDWFKI